MKYSKTFTVDSCSNCPLRGWEKKSSMTCNVGGSPLDTIPRIPPKNCPLRKGIVHVNIDGRLLEG